jgi:hypothetical protein
LPQWSRPSEGGWPGARPTVNRSDNSGWIVQVDDEVSAADMTLYVICVNAS